MYKLPQEEIEYFLAINGAKYRGVLSDLAKIIRDHIKYKDNPPTSWVEFEEIFYDLLNAYGIDLLNEY